MLDTGISVVFGILGIIFNSCQNIVDHHYDISVFRKWDYFRHDWKKKYVLNNPVYGRKKWLGFIIIPAFFFDGWHLFKVLRQICQASVVWFLAEWVVGLAGFYLSWWSYFLFLVLVGLRNSLVHTIFYNYILRKREE